MAQPYFDRLTGELRHLGASAPRGVLVECKHFFSGAALYANGRIFASLTPAGLAIKLPEDSRSALRRERRGRRLVAKIDFLELKLTDDGNLRGAIFDSSSRWGRVLFRK